jgi:hypothetical protein
MAYLRPLVAAFLLLISAQAFAGYAQLVPPAAFTAATATSSAMFNGAAAANEATWLAGTVRTNAALNVAGNLVKMPVTMRLAANAPSFLAARIGTGLLAGMGGPVGVGLTVAACLALPAIQAWIAKADPSISVDENGNWTQIIKDDYFKYTFDYPGVTFSSAEEGCAAYNKNAHSTPVIFSQTPDDIMFNCVYDSGGSAGYVYGHRNIGGKVNPIDYQSQVLPKLSQTPLPDDLPAKLPLPLPVEQPLINPSPDPVPVPKPLLVPQGDPVPVPNTSPQQYKQPMVRVTPSPTIDEPWRVDVTPEDQTSTDPKGITQPMTEPSTSTATSTPKTETDFCVLHPEILACQKLDTPDSPDLQTRDKSVAITPDGGWGALSATCPAAKHVTIAGRDVPIPYDLFCTYASMIRPLLLAFAWLSAAFILVGAVRET